MAYNEPKNRMKWIEKLEQEIPNHEIDDQETQQKIRNSCLSFSKVLSKFDEKKLFLSKVDALIEKSLKDENPFKELKFCEKPLQEHKISCSSMKLSAGQKIEFSQANDSSNYERILSKSTALVDNILPIIEEEKKQTQSSCILSQEICDEFILHKLSESKTSQGSSQQANSLKLQIDYFRDTDPIKNKSKVHSRPTDKSKPKYAQKESKADQSLSLKVENKNTNLNHSINSKFIEDSCISKEQKREVTSLSTSIQQEETIQQEGACIITNKHIPRNIFNLNQDKSHSSRGPNYSGERQCKISGSVELSTPKFSSRCDKSTNNIICSEKKNHLINKTSRNDNEKLKNSVNELKLNFANDNKKRLLHSSKSTSNMKKQKENQLTKQSKNLSCSKDKKNCSSTSKLERHYSSGNYNSLNTTEQMTGSRSLNKSMNSISKGKQAELDSQEYKISSGSIRNLEEPRNECLNSKDIHTRIQELKNADSQKECDNVNAKNKENSPSNLSALKRFQVDINLDSKIVRITVFEGDDIELIIRKLENLFQLNALQVSLLSQNLKLFYHEMIEEQC